MKKVMIFFGLLSFQLYCEQNSSFDVATTRKEILAAYIASLGSHGLDTSGRTEYGGLSFSLNRLNKNSYVLKFKVCEKLNGNERLVSKLGQHGHFLNEQERYKMSVRQCIRYPEFNQEKSNSRDFLHTIAVSPNELDRLYKQYTPSAIDPDLMRK